MEVINLDDTGEENDNRDCLLQKTALVQAQ